MRSRILKGVFLCASVSIGSAAWSDENVMVVFDGSNSMWGQIDGAAKIEIARGVMDNLLGEWVDDRNVGLMAYGHRRRGDCGDIEVLIEPGADSRAAILERINGVTPTGKTPLTDAVEQAARALSYMDQPATVVLISDGLESCERDPCALATALEQGGVGFTAHVVGFGLSSEEDASSLSCIAENTGGQYITATNATELGAALSAVSTAVAETVPEQEPEPAAPAVVVDGPDTSVAGSDMDVTWTPTVEEGDYINVVPAGSDANVFGTYVRIGNATEVTVVTPGDEGLYEVRYLHNQTKKVLGQKTLEVTKAEVELTTPETVETGARFDVEWTPTINQRDYVSIVPLGSDAGTFGNYQAVGKKSKTALVAPADPGLYEVRYILNINKSTVATRQIEVSEPQITLQVSEAALTGAKFDVSWSRAISKGDYITIVPMGADEGVYGNYITVRDTNKGVLKAPAETGMYEVRYVLREGNKTLASEAMEVTAAEVTITGPAKVVTGEKFEVSWTGTVDVQDYIAIVPAGSDEGVYGNYQVVRDKGTGTLTAQAEPGLYELRYILREGAKTLATATIEITDPEVTIAAPDTVLAGSKFEVSWTGTVSAQDYINIVPLGTDDGVYGNYLVVRDNSSGGLQAPSEPGMYEIRYLLREGSKTVTAVTVEVTEPEVTIAAPSEVRAGEELRVTWTGTVNGSDYVNLVPFGTSDDTYGQYSQVRDRGEHDMKAPEETGLYEVRYMLREGNRVLARQEVEVLAADAKLNTGGDLTAPDTASPGSTIEVSWSVESESADQRITLARGDQAIFTWISAEKITEAPPLSIKVPDEPGIYEIRFLDLANKAVLSRKVIEVK
ncbi:MAG: VWA domain-containing protein [Ruegeria sp.]